MKALHLGFVFDCQEDYLAQGFTPEQVAEFDPRVTVEGIAAGLHACGHEVSLVGNGQALARALAQGQRYDLVFNIAEGLTGFSREAQVPALCELYRQKYTFSDPLTCALTLHKAMAKRVVRDAGLPTAQFFVVESPQDLREIPFPGPYFAKPVAEGSSKGISARCQAQDASTLQEVCRELLASFQQPVLVERFLSGREVTVGIVGNGRGARVLGVMEVEFTERAEAQAYTALNKEEYRERVRYRLLQDEELARQAGDLALAVYHLLGCRDAARLDLRCDETGTPQFLEANPLPGLDPIRSDLPILARLAGVEYVELLSAIVEAAWTRRW
ncbi:MAG: D-alanine--D-alanine ligase family protein [Acidobacteriota bacterium]